MRFWNQILETAYLFYHRFVFSLAILRTKKCEKLVKMLIKITGNVCIILPIILLLTNETEKNENKQIQKSHTPPPTQLFRKRKYENDIWYHNLIFTSLEGLRICGAGRIWKHVFDKYISEIKKKIMFYHFH